MFAGLLNMRILLLIPFLLFPCYVNAERLPIKPYTVADGLPNNVINKIVRDSRGFLWFCTAEGLSRFDGYSFTNYGTAEGLPHPNVSLCRTRHRTSKTAIALFGSATNTSNLTARALALRQVAENQNLYNTEF